MTGLEIMQERVRFGQCPICGEDIKKDSYKVYKHPVMGDVKICAEHPLPGEAKAE